jgi:F-type H+-transporting ATPase subunit epsilon
MASLHVAVLTPEVALWQGAASAVTARTSMGDLTVLAQHTPLVGDVVASVVRVEADGSTVYIAIDGGYLQVEPDGEGGTRATVMAGVAQIADSAEKARQALEALSATA